ncbi:MAG: YCF48-related protein [Candidatus Kapaibacterium sp.]
MKLQKTVSPILDGLILLVFILFFSSAGFQDKNTMGWYQQYFPNLNGSTIKDMTFLDSLTGFAVTNTNSSLQAYILKTTNGGDNWNINYTYSQSNINWYFVKIGFVDSNTGFAFGETEMFKTTNGGDHWNIIINDLYPHDIAIINKDTMLAVLSNGFNGGVYRSTNGGINWQNIWNNGPNYNPKKIYMYDKNLGFACIDFQHPQSYRTTNGGLNWTNLNDSGYSAIKFYDSLTGWKGFINETRKTTDGGLTWIRQTPPSTSSFACRSLSIINKDTLWFVGCEIIQNSWYKGIICKTTNGGLNWGYQVPDTSIHIVRYDYINFVGNNNGWAYFLNTGVHTNTGGIINGISNNQNIIISDYKLFQNYPNPFNPSTTISYNLSKSGNVRIKVFDVTGKEIEELVNKILQAGSYKITFNPTKYTSGIYFYSMIIDGKVLDTKRMVYIR